MDEFYAICCEDEDCLWQETVPDRATAISRAENEWCGRCMGSLRPFRFESMARSNKAEVRNPETPGKKDDATRKGAA